VAKPFGESLCITSEAINAFLQFAAGFAHDAFHAVFVHEIFGGPLLAPRKPALVGSNALFENLERFCSDDVLRMPTDSSHRRNGLGLSGGSNFFSHHAGRLGFHTGAAGR
jgi:hypothetical protein